MTSRCWTPRRGEDLTRLVMTQIITESAKGPDSVFPLDILREMVVASGKASQESALNYMRAVADMYKEALRGLSHTMTPFEMMQKMMTPALGTQAPAEKSQASDLKAQEPQTDTELQELRRRIQELEALVLKRGKASPRPKKRVRHGSKP